MRYVCHSAAVRSDDVWVCLPNGDAYKAEAYANGAVGHLTMTREELAAFSHAHFDDPSRALTVIGITGTNGKTTVAHLAGQCLEKLGHCVMVQGTLTQSLTTPEIVDTTQAMAAHRDAGGTHFVMEVSSHAIHQGRISGIDFDVRLLTNVTQDHLDYHGSMAEYRRVKESFIAYDTGISQAMYEAGYPAPIETPLLGEFNQSNAKAALAILTQLGVDQARALELLATVEAPPGRLERIHEAPLVVVDFAHTPDGLRVVSDALANEAARRGGRLWIVFGCGGDRDIGKRPIMGEIASRLGDEVVITQDNPRSEDPDAIARDIQAGCTGSATVRIIQDRGNAIDVVLSEADGDDVVVLAGKGHETTQVIGDVAHPFNDGARVRAFYER